MYSTWREAGEHHLLRRDEEKCDIERAVSYGAGILTCESIRHATLISEVMLECIQEGAYEAEFAETKSTCHTAPDKWQPVWHVA